MGLALKEAGYEVIHFSISGRPEKCTCVDGRYYHRGMELIKVHHSQQRIPRGLEYYYIGWIHYALAIEKFHPTKEDIVVFYSSDFGLMSGLRIYAKLRGMKTVACWGDYFPDDIYAANHKPREFRLYKYTVRNIIPKCDVLIPISHYLENVLAQWGRSSTVIPIMADVEEFNPVFSKDFSGKLKLVFPVTGMMKENLEGIFQGLSQLDDSVLESFEFHITQFWNAQERLQNIFDSMEDAHKRDLLKKALVYHPHLEYDALVELYRQMHFMLLIRQSNQMNLAGFPSKLPETMAFGIIPIATQMGDYAQFYLREGQNSFLIDGTDAQECSRAISRALNTDRETLNAVSHNAYLTAKEKFDYHNWVDVLKKALADR